MHISCFIKRNLIFSIITFVCVQHVIIDENKERLLKDRIETNLEKFNVKMNLDTGLIIKYFKLANIAVAVMLWLAVVFNLTVGKLCASIYFGVVCMIYYNPALPESKINSDNLYGLTKDFLLYVALFLGMLAYSFKTCEDCVLTTTAKNAPQTNEKEDIRVERTTTPAPKTNKKKKKVD